MNFTLPLQRGLMLHDLSVELKPKHNHVATVPEAPLEPMILLGAGKRNRDEGDDSKEKAQPKKIGPRPISDEENVKRKAEIEAEKAKIKAAKMIEREALKVIYDVNI